MQTAAHTRVSLFKAQPNHRYGEAPPRCLSWSPLAVVILQASNGMLRAGCCCFHGAHTPSLCPASCTESQRRLDLIPQCPGRLLSAGCLLLDALLADFARASLRLGALSRPRDQAASNQENGDGTAACGENEAQESQLLWRTRLRVATEVLQILVERTCVAVLIGTLADARACLWRCGGLYFWLLRSQCITCFACICSPMRMRMVCVCRVFAVEGGRNS